MKLWSLGTVLKVNRHKVCIIGYTSTGSELASVAGYLVVSYPLGFINIDKVFFVPAHAEYEILAEGYKTNVSERILETLQKGFEIIKSTPDEKLVKFNEEYKKIISQSKEAERK